MNSNEVTGTDAVDLGSDFPTNVPNLYELNLLSPKGGNAITYLVENKNNGAIARGTITTNMPTSASFLASQVWINNGSQSITSVRASISIINI